jgi:hypothetical protein
MSVKSSNVKMRSENAVLCCEISGSHGAEYEFQSLLGCTAVFSIRCRPTFQMRLWTSVLCCQKLSLWGALRVHCVQWSRGASILPVYRKKRPSVKNMACREKKAAMWRFCFNSGSLTRQEVFAWFFGFHEDKSSERCIVLVTKYRLRLQGRTDWFVCTETLRCLTVC